MVCTENSHENNLAVQSWQKVTQNSFRIIEQYTAKQYDYQLDNWQKRKKASQ